MKKKKLWKSKTIWFNAIVVALASAEAAFGVLQPVLPGNVYGWLSFMLAVGNAVLRFYTTQAVCIKNPEAKQCSTD